VAGLGNRAITPDALGPFAAEQIAATRHLSRRFPELFADLRPVCVVSPGVLGTTGLETAEILGGIIDRVRPACLLALDALCAADSGRLCRTVQLCDTGITPGEGTGTARCQLDQEGLGIPVIGLGIPTVTDVSTLVREQTGQQAAEPGWLVSRSDIDFLVRQSAGLLAGAVNMALHPELTARELALMTLA
jgi:spore protease